MKLISCSDQLRSVKRQLFYPAEINLSNDYKNSNPGIEWKKIAGIRDKLIHGYFSIDYDIVWDVVENKIPELRDSIIKKSEK